MFGSEVDTFEVETFEYPRKCSWTVWNVTLGSDMIKSQLRHYFRDTDVVIYVHDCDPRRDSSQDNIPHIHLWDEKHCQFHYIVPNKQDLLSPEQARDIAINLPKHYEKKLSRYQQKILWKIVDHKISAATGEGVREILDEMYHELSRRQYPISMSPPSPRLTISSPRLEGRIRRGSSVDPPDAAAFWELFTSADIPSWDHQVHLKAAYILVLEYIKLQRSTFAMADTFLAHLRILRLIQPHKFSSNEHLTLTIFWLVQLQAAIIDYSLHNDLDRYPCWHDFYNILFHQPTLQNPRLWSAYFTDNDLFCGDRAWHKWVSPSRQPLPALAPPLDQPADMPFVHGGLSRLLRFAFAVMQYIEKSPSEDVDVIAKALAILQPTTVHLRAKGVGIPPYSKTHACYWIHIARACLLSLDSIESGQTINASQMSFADFGALAANCAVLENVVGRRLKREDAEKSPQSLEDVLSTILSKPGNVDIAVPSCCAQPVDCDWGIPTDCIKISNFAH
ncbi:hypothetical protein BDW42DRAFT_182663 [Aspergillus taichungensis]|uniref:Uncharacterized protein n=1 Tax=Aspergillus taichungensis TaxID=482145 RepID=A0A2J5I822_9EURO|nr:hypothetical protein BDW42DRAFT_182663 [Aspergillus taichungensis]